MLDSRRNGLGSPVHVHRQGEVGRCEDADSSPPVWRPRRSSHRPALSRSVRVMGRATRPSTTAGLHSRGSWNAELRLAAGRRKENQVRSTAITSSRTPKERERSATVGHRHRSSLRDCVSCGEGRHESVGPRQTFSLKCDPLLTPPASAARSRRVPAVGTASPAARARRQGRPSPDFRFLPGAFGRACACGSGLGACVRRLSDVTRARVSRALRRRSL